MMFSSPIARSEEVRENRTTPALPDSSFVRIFSPAQDANKSGISSNTGINFIILFMLFI